MGLKSKISNFFLNRKISNEGGETYSKTIRLLYFKKYNIKIGYGTYGGCFNTRNIPPGVRFGNYCSIAPNVKIFRANHPKDYFTLHPLFYNPVMGYVQEDRLIRPRLEIGHDVWMGEWSVILPSVISIGNGVIIGAGSVVTKDVPPYCIVAGNPAKIIGKRFSDHIIQKLESTQWWNWDKETLIKNSRSLEDIVNGK